MAKNKYNKMSIGKEIALGRESDPKGLSVSIGITYIDGRIIFKLNKKASKAFYGICEWYKNICIIAPLDWEKITMVTTHQISPTENYCSRAFTCLSTPCPLNRFDRDLYLNEFSDCGAFSLGLPKNFGRGYKPWFTEGKWKNFWPKFILQTTGGALRFDEKKGDKILNE